MQDYTQCDLCNAPETVSEKTLKARTASSEREFENEEFTVWQCKNCKSIHALEGVDLAHYYSVYGLHEQNEPNCKASVFPLPHSVFECSGNGSLLGQLRWFEHAQ